MFLKLSREEALKLVAPESSIKRLEDLAVEVLVNNMNQIYEDKLYTVIQNNVIFSIFVKDTYVYRLFDFYGAIEKICDTIKQIGNYDIVQLDIDHDAKIVTVIISVFPESDDV